MTLSRRAAAIETALSPTQLVIRWLDEAHSFGDLTSYVRSLVDAEPPELPLDRLCREAAAGARARVPGRRSEALDRAVRSALRETLFRFELVMRINVTAHDLLEREALIEAALGAHLTLLTSEGPEERRGDTVHQQHLASRRDLALLRVSELHAAQQARMAVEDRYLAGRPALFPDVVTDWDERLRSTGLVVDLANRLAEIAGVPPAEPIDPAVHSAGVLELERDLVEPARATALERLGEGERAQGIATGWLRPKLERSRARVVAD